MNLQNLAKIEIILAISLLIAVIVSWVLMYFKKDPFLIRPELGWVLILLLQAVYLSMDIAESVTKQELYGVIAGGFMITLGFVIWLLSILEKRMNIPHIIEGLFYLTFGIILVIIRGERENKRE